MYKWLYFCFDYSLNKKLTISMRHHLTYLKYLRPHLRVLFRLLLPMLLMTIPVVMESTLVPIAILNEHLRFSLSQAYLQVNKCLEIQEENLQNFFFLANMHFNINVIIIMTLSVPNTNLFDNIVVDIHIY